MTTETHVVIAMATPSLGHAITEAAQAIGFVAEYDPKCSMFAAYCDTVGQADELANYLCELFG